MPLEVQVDHERRIVIATGRGTLTSDEMFGYQNDVWSRSEVSGYDEIVDMSAVEHIEGPSTERIRELAALSAGMDPKGSRSRFAIVAPHDFAFGLGRSYEIFRELNPRSSKEVSVFRSMEAALQWLARKAE